MLRSFPPKSIAFMLFAFVLCSIQNAAGQSAFSLEAWMKQNTAFKTALVKGVIERAAQDNITIRLPPEYYVKEIDQLILNMIRNGNEAALKNSTGASLKTIAVMDCDWDNGKDRVEYAREFLGQALFERFKIDYPEKYKKLLGGCHE